MFKITAISHGLRRIVPATILFSLMSHAAAETTDRSSAYFGIGFETITYSETLKLLGNKLTTDSSLTNLVQRSGSYIATGDKSGFYINTSTSLLAQNTGEEWNYSGYGTIQQNEITSERQTLDLLATYRFQPHHGLLAGLRYQKLSFNRYDFSASSGTTAFEANVANLNINPNYVVSETATSFGLGFGYEYDDFFVGTDKGLKWNAQILISSPFYSTIANTNVPELSFSKNFAGYDINARIATGWQLNKHVTIALGLEANYSKRDEVKEKTSTLPKNTLLTIQPALSAHWSF